MPWNEPPAAEARVRSVLLPALLSLCLTGVALCLPPAALAAVALAWWCWWICGRDAATRGFGWTLAALVAGHAALLAWLVLLAIAVDGARGLTLLSLALLTYVVICLAVTRPSAWKYAITTFCFCAVAASLVFNAIDSARYDAQRSLTSNILRQLGIDRHRVEQQGATMEGGTGSNWTPPIFRNIYDDQHPLPAGHSLNSPELRSDGDLQVND